MAPPITIRIVTVPAITAGAIHARRPLRSPFFQPPMASPARPAIAHRNAVREPDIQRPAQLIASTAQAADAE